MCCDFSKLILFTFALFLISQQRTRRRRVRDPWGNWCDAKDLEGQTFEVTLIPSDDSEVKIVLSVYICVSLMSHITLVLYVSMYRSLSHINLFV